jgi:hypothetical protein
MNKSYDALQAVEDVDGIFDEYESTCQVFTSIHQIFLNARHSNEIFQRIRKRVQTFVRELLVRNTQAMLVNSSQPIYSAPKIALVSNLESRVTSCDALLLNEIVPGRLIETKPKEELMKLMATHYDDLRAVYRAYALNQRRLTRSNFRRFMSDLLIDHLLPENELNAIFGNLLSWSQVHSDQYNQILPEYDDDENEEAAIETIGFFSFMEAIVHLAHQSLDGHPSRPRKGNSLILHRTSIFISQFVLENSQRAEMREFQPYLRSSQFRKVLVWHLPMLLSWFDKRAAVDAEPRQSDGFVELEEVTGMMGRAAFKNVLKETKIDSRVPKQVPDLVVDLVQHQREWGEEDDVEVAITFTEFIEALAVLACWANPNPYLPIELRFDTMLRAVNWTPPESDEDGI